MADGLLFTKADKIATITLNRPDKLHTLDHREAVAAFKAKHPPQFKGC